MADGPRSRAADLQPPRMNNDFDPLLISDNPSCVCCIDWLGHCPLAWASTLAACRSPPSPRFSIAFNAWSYQLDLGPRSNFSPNLDHQILGSMKLLSLCVPLQESIYSRLSPTSHAHQPVSYQSAPASFPLHTAISYTFVCLSSVLDHCLHSPSF